jgi:hypothetical protein
MIMPAVSEWVSDSSVTTPPLNSTAQAGAARGLGGRLELVLRGVVDLRLGHRVDDVRIGDPPVARDRARLVGIGDAHHVLALGDLRQRRLEGGLVVRLGDRLALRCGEDHAGCRAARLGELLLEQVLSGLRLGPGDRELVVGLAAERGGAAEDDRDHGYPDAERLEPMLERPPADSM